MLAGNVATSMEWHVRHSLCVHESICDWMSGRLRELHALLTNELRKVHSKRNVFAAVTVVAEVDEKSRSTDFSLS